MEPRTAEYPLLHPRVSNEARILSWNVSYGDHPNHADDVVSALESIDCDILCLSEVVGETVRESLHALGYGGVYIEANYRLDLLKLLRPIQGGIMFFSRFAIEDLRVVQTMSDGLLYVRRYYIEARLRVSDNFKVTVGMTHHSLPFESRYKEACNALCREVAKQNEEFLLVGDLNSPPKFRVIRELENLLTNLGPATTEPSFVSKRLPRWIYSPKRLDYAFATTDMLKWVKEVRLLPSGPSDHRPVFVRLEAN
jgi:endonuclease/exonuclease/phosphatase family metal-dependent hydrolase